jgi:predicted translin family RNA/ssDNA-binding protein
MNVFDLEGESRRQYLDFVLSQETRQLAGIVQILDIMLMIIKEPWELVYCLDKKYDVNREEFNENGSVKGIRVFDVIFLSLDLSSSGSIVRRSVGV